MRGGTYFLWLAPKKVSKERRFTPLTLSAHLQHDNGVVRKAPCRADLYAWLKDGAALYVCGDANAMAKDVHATLLRILADQGKQDEAAAKAELDGIRRDGRYLRDVY